MGYRDKRKKRLYEKRYRHTPKFREKMRKYAKIYNNKKRLELLVLAGGIRCVKCGFGDYRALQIDHVLGDGSSERHLIGNTGAFIKMVKKSPERYQVLCANCNWIKRYEKDETYKKKVL